MTTTTQLSTTVRDLMARPVIGVAPSRSVRQALELMNEHGISHLPVIQHGRVVGVVCTCDLERTALNADVSSAMSSPAISVDASSTLDHAAALMSSAAVGSLLVTEEGDVAGLITPADFVRAGVAELALGERRCRSCGAYEHVHRATDDQWWCADCRARRDRAANGDELGGGD